MVELAKLVRVYLVPLFVLPVWLIFNLDRLPPGNGSEESSEKVGGELKNVILSEGDNRASLLVLLQFELLAEKVKPCEVVQPLELPESPEHLPEKFLFIRGELLIK